MRVFMERKSVTSRATEPSLWRPESRETADHSGPYLIAAGLVDGDISEETFEPERYGDPALLSVVDTIELIEDADYTAAFPWNMSCRFEVQLKDGRSLTVVGDKPKGHPRPADVRRRARRPSSWPRQSLDWESSAPASCSTPSGTSSRSRRSSACST